MMDGCTDTLAPSSFGCWMAVCRGRKFFVCFFFFRFWWHFSPLKILHAEIKRNKRSVHYQLEEREPSARFGAHKRTNALNSILYRHGFHPTRLGSPSSETRPNFGPFPNFVFLFFFALFLCVSFPSCFWFLLFASCLHTPFSFFLFRCIKCQLTSNRFLKRRHN